jgi:hypothetical protein
VRSYCSRFHVEPLRSTEVSSGGSSRAIQPSDVAVEVHVLPDRIEVKERLRDGVHTRGQLLGATLALLLLLVVVTAATALVVRQRRRSRPA